MTLLARSHVTTPLLLFPTPTSPRSGTHCNSPQHTAPGQLLRESSQQPAPDGPTHPIAAFSTPPHAPPGRGAPLRGLSPTNNLMRSLA
ncbi:hypothetical protein P691DRAFT_805694 [Macrolepiota fuliginosa MF-IS2]|uniref:Uncharacterized protein n=1 Tax=Macrolepiota fuliginosa MF-IS2 TaxID=1400762 RepID=A0A9P6C198_9AGAR|nr:hypothetical protein P691DRAFT_805694 [Macrolepiota fuliginosa MF-IS2]